MGRFFVLCILLIGVGVDAFHLVHQPAAPTAANHQLNQFPVSKEGVQQQCRGSSSSSSSGIKNTLSRKELWKDALASAAAVLVANVAFVHPVVASEGSALFRTFNDPIHGFSMQVPSNWVESTRTLPDRRKIQLWTNPTDPRVLVFVAYTPIRDDFTSIASFGSVEQVAAQTILPKGQLAGVDVVSEMLSTRSAQQAYYFDYTQLVPDVQPLTHFRAIFALQQGATGGAGAVLVTVTAQAPQDVYATVQPTFDRIVDSFGKSS